MSNSSPPGFTIFLTGLPAAGKSTIAQGLADRFEQIGRLSTVLDGDVVRARLSPDLGYSRQDRDLNILRIGYVASEVTKHGGIAICAAIAPYAAVRNEVRKSVSRSGEFIEVYVSTPIEVCQQRDPKGLYQKARDGLISGLTGWDDPYERPHCPELVIDTTAIDRDVAVENIWQELAARRLVRTFADDWLVGTHSGRC